MTAPSPVGNCGTVIGTRRAFQLGKDVPFSISLSLLITCNVIVPGDLVRLAARTQSHDEKHCDVAQWRGKS